MTTLCIENSDKGRCQSHVRRTFQKLDDLLLVLEEHQQLRSLEIYEFKISHGKE
jgi:hypothetical protein